MPDERAKLVLALHAHQPWVRHPEHADVPEERWFFDAVTDTYLPLLDRLLSLRDDGVPTRLTLSLSPTLLAMLTDPLLQSRYVRHLERLILSTDEEVRRLRHEPTWQAVALVYRETLRAARRSFSDRHEGQLVAAFRGLAEVGVLELAASAATHAHLPLHVAQPRTVAAQIRLGVEEFERHFGFAPAGFWLPDCGFARELDDPLADAGIRWVILEGHALALARPAPVLGLRAPILTPRGVAAFGRDRGLASVAWSRDEGYPGDPDYRDFESDDVVPLESRGSLSPPGSERVSTVVKYFKHGGPGQELEPYDPAAARAKANAHASNFVLRCAAWLEGDVPRDRPASLVVAYDAELLGQYWYEGPSWLEQVVRRVAYDPHAIELASPSDVLACAPVLQQAEPAASSWGEGGHHAPWLTGECDWLRPLLHAAGERMGALADRHPAARGTQLRALNQAARELLLAQAGDWPLMMSRGTSPDYAVARARRHLGDFFRLADEIECDGVEIDGLSEIEARDNVFPGLDYRIFE